MTEEEMIQKSKDEFILKYGEGTQLITWGVAKVVRDVSDGQDTMKFDAVNPPALFKGPWACSGISFL